jgi:DNA polymerase elongation subunit (family B)
MEHFEYLQLKKQKEELEYKINFLDTKQLAEKLLINATYGAFSNKYCSISDIDIAESVTLTGQGAIKHARKLVKQFISEKSGITNDSKLDDCLIFGDTDSIGVSLTPMFPEGISKDGLITDEAYKVSEELEDYLNGNMQKWANKVLNSSDPRFKFKRELMCDSAIFLAKKRYVFHILDKEGFKTDTWKYTGVELVRTTMPKAIKPYVKEIVHKLILTKSQQQTNDLLTDAYNTFNTLPISDISLVSGVNTYMKYASQCNGFETVKRMPCAVKAAYFYNLIIKQLGLSEKYEEIRTGDKVKYFYVQKPNKYNIDAIAYKYKYPEEFNSIFRPDTEKMFEKDMYQCIERFYQAMKWTPRKPNNMLYSDLEEEFSN